MALGGVFLAYLIDYACVLIEYVYQLLVLSENDGQFNQLLCHFNRLLVCLLRVIHYISSSSPHQKLHYSSIYSRHLPQPTETSLSLYKSPNLLSVTPKSPLITYF